MPTTRSAKKALRRDRRRTIINLGVKKRVREAIKTARKSPTAKNLSLAFSALDQAVKKEVIHQGKADRLKSRLAKLLPPKKVPKKTSR